LRKYGFATAIAEDGEQAIQIAKTKDISLLLLDLGLPILDGWKVLREIRAHGSTLPIIVLTAQVSESSKTNAFACGATFIRSRNHETHFGYWYSLAIIFFILSIDETATIHERLNRVYSLIKVGGLVDYSILHG
jgi:CheY-like chemotaxis protein